ncbi:hypothetical protein [Gynurincola endophyticus]|uniref:hypothetical protein n=1 Tax=Gynurincola endophyticus TaxID=2479004 RepID=UPI000F8D8473|nr:hypothetical protein [Gynurincola endophyticus]
MKRFIYLALLLSFIACKNQPENTEENNEYLRFEDALQSDVAHLMQYGSNILYKKWENQVLTDSMFIDTTGFIDKIKDLWLEEMQAENFAKLFQEVPVVDEASNQIHFHYLAKIKNSKLAEVKVITAPNKQQEYVITTVMFEISDADKTQKVMWKLQEMIQIITQYKNGDGKVTVEELIWEPSLFFE